MIDSVAVNAPILELRDVTFAFGDRPLLDRAGLRLEAGERLALVGRNGEGKSTLLQLIAGGLEPDAGELVRGARLRVALLDQEVPRGLAGTVYDCTAEGLGELGDLLAEAHHLGLQLAGRPDPGRPDPAGDPTALLRRLDEVQHALEVAGGWRLRNRVETVLTRLELPADDAVATLSSGLKRRVFLARALVAEPDLLLLDEPTNHLDIPAIEKLEEILLGLGSALLFVTHDRAFLRRLATRIVELDRGRLQSFPGNYDAYLERKRQELEVESAQEKAFDKVLAREEVWIRQGIKARRTRNEGRVRALEKLRAERQARRRVQGSARMRLDDTARSGKRVIETRGVTFAYGGEAVIDDSSTRILRGDKVGIIGPNGAGKTTLLRLLLKDLEPQSGRVEHGTRLEVAYFDQLRATLDEERTVADNVAEGADRIVVGGQTRHVISYLQDFLFPPQRARSPVSSLSGGERNRLLLARLFSRPFNLLVMDEPTNDLDIETLELLEERLLELSGTLLLVSHDRAFLNNVVTSTLVLEGGGRVGEYAGGYDDWLRQRPATAAVPAAGERPPRHRRPQPGPKPRKRTFKERRELEALPGQIEELEAEVEALHARLADPELYRGPGDEIAAAKARLAEVEKALAAAFERWEELEAIPE